MTLSKSKALTIVLLAAVAGATFAHGEPMHVYLTYSDAPETSIDINILLPAKVESVSVFYDTEARGDDPTAYTHQLQATYCQTTMELSDRRALYVATLKDLTPGTVYHFVAGETKYGMSKPRKFKTLPGGDKPFRFVNGGDMGVDGLVVPLLKLAAKEDPDFVVIGGDLAYVNGLLAGNERWDTWLRNWDENMVASDGRMIPIITAIGNHETNAYKDEDKAIRAPWYMGLFGRQGKELYYSRKVGENLVFIVLDSGHLTPHDGAQAEWLAQELEKYQRVKYKFAVYHVPLYPSHRPYDGVASQLGRTHWGPLFDKYGLTVALEHHDHTFKRTKPLKGNVVDPTGTVYVGDGCFGRDPRPIDPELRWYNHAEASKANFWVIDVSSEGLKFKAIDDQANQLDAFTLP